MLALPAGALVGVPGAAFVAMVAPGGGACAMTTTARRMVLAAAPGVALHQGGGGGPAGACLRRGVVCFKEGGTPSSGDDEAKLYIQSIGHRALCLFLLHDRCHRRCVGCAFLDCSAPSQEFFCRGEGEGGRLGAEAGAAVGEAEELEGEVGAAGGGCPGDDAMDERRGERRGEQADGVLEAGGPRAAADHVEDGLVEGLLAAGRVGGRRRRLRRRHLRHSLGLGLGLRGRWFRRVEGGEGMAEERRGGVVAGEEAEGEVEMVAARHGCGGVEEWSSGRRVEGLGGGRGSTPPTLKSVMGPYLIGPLSDLWFWAF